MSAKTSEAIAQEIQLREAKSQRLADKAKDVAAAIEANGVTITKLQEDHKAAQARESEKGSL